MHISSICSHKQRTGLVSRFRVALRRPRSLEFERNGAHGQGCDPAFFIGGAIHFVGRAGTPALALGAKNERLPIGCIGVFFGVSGDLAYSRYSQHYWSWPGIAARHAGLLGGRTGPDSRPAHRMSVQGYPHSRGLRCDPPAAQDSRSGFGQAEEGRVLVCVYERQRLDTTRRCPTRHSLIVNDMLCIPAAMEKGDRLTTMFPCLDHYALDPKTWRFTTHRYHHRAHRRSGRPTIFPCFSIRPIASWALARSP